MKTVEHETGIASKTQTIGDRHIIGFRHEQSVRHNKLVIDFLQLGIKIRDQAMQLQRVGESFSSS